MLESLDAKELEFLESIDVILQHTASNEGTSKRFVILIGNLNSHSLWAVCIKK